MAQVKELSREELKELYDYVSYFHGDLAVVRKDGEYFHIRPNGKPAYEERFEMAGDFHGGLATVRESDKWFHIRPNGKPAYEARFDRVASFRGGRTARALKDGEWFRINPDGIRVDK